MTQTNTANDIAELYSKVSRLIPPNKMREIVYNHVQTYLNATRKKSLQEKCIEFYLARQSFLSVIRHNSNFNDDEWFAGLGDSALDYFDMTFAYLFFKGTNEKCAIERKVDKEFYFCLLSVAMDRIEFPSLVSSEFRESYASNNRSSVSLDRRNYLALTMRGAKMFVNQVIEAVVMKLKRAPSWTELRMTYKRNLRSFNNEVSKNYDEVTKTFNESRCEDGYKLYRGYEIDIDQNVIVDRRIRRQDANKSTSFTTERKVAELYATYRTRGGDNSKTTSFDNRITLAKTMFGDKTDPLLNAFGKKCIVSEYVVPESDIILFPMSTTITECEVFAIPDNARLSRYTIVNAYQ